MTKLTSHWPVVVLACAAVFAVTMRESAPTHVNAASANIGLSRDVDNPPHHPFAREVSCNIPGGSKSCVASFTVDVNKELVIETASVLGTIPTGGRAWAVINALTGGTNLSSVQLPLGFQATFAGTVDTYAWTQSFRLYADPGSTVSLAGEEQPVGSATFTFDVSGYTVDCGSSGASITNPCPLP